MKANHRARTRTGATGDEGVSNVLGGILFFALMFSVFVVIRISYVPIWEEDREARHMENVNGQLSALKSEVDRQASNRSAVEVAHPVTLSTTSTSRFFTPATLPGTLSFDAGTAGARITANELLVLAQSGRSTAAVSEDWVDITGPVELENVADLQHLRIRVFEPWNAASGDEVNLTLTDVNGDYAGSLEVYVFQDPPEKFINMKTIGPDGTVIYDQGEAFHQVSDVDFWWIDALQDEAHFADVLNAVQAPFTITMTENGLDAEYTIVFLEDDGSGSVLVGTSGITISDFNRTLNGGTLSLTSQNSHFVSQDFYLENGALLIVQDGVATMRIEPELEIEQGNSFTRVRTTVPALIGATDSLSQRGTATVTTDAASSTQIIGTSPMWSYSVDTQWPSVWEDFFRQTANDAGFSEGAGHFAITSDSGSVTFNFYGTTTDPSSTDHDLSVQLTYATVKVSLDT